MSVWVCSRIAGLRAALEKVLPKVNFQEVTTSNLTNCHHDNEKPIALVADNPEISPLLYKESVPFKFVQV